MVFYDVFCNKLLTCLNILRTQNTFHGGCHDCWTNNIRKVYMSTHPFPFREYM